jgi:mRNA interferase MazF
VVLQADELLVLPTAIVAPASTSARPASSRPEIEIDGTTTRVMVDQLTAVDPGRLGETVGFLTRAELSDVETAAVTVLGL